MSLRARLAQNPGAPAAEGLSTWPAPSLTRALTGEEQVASASFVARQPIYDAALETFGYELLFRAGEQALDARVDDADSATARTLVATLADIGLETLVGDLPFFVNVSRRFVLAGHTRVLPASRACLELADQSFVDEDLLAELGALAAEGYAIVLDESHLHESRRVLLDVARFVKLDAQALAPEVLARHVQALAGRDLKLVAEKVEDHETFERCRAIGFDYFQGYFFCRPRTVAGRGVPASRASTVQLMAALQDPRAGLEDLEDVIGRDPGLAYRLLRYINSAHFALPHPVSSIGHAVRLLGERNIRSWATLLVLAQLDTAPAALTRTGLTRARMAELLALALGRPGPEAHFTVGLLSIVDAAMEARMEDVVSALPLDEDLRAALLHHQGAYGDVYGWVLDWEQGRFERLRGCPLSNVLLRDAYLKAVAYADELGTALG